MADAQTYIEIIDNGFKTPEHQASVKAASDKGLSLPSSFCQAWPVIKPIMQTVGGVLLWIPVWGTTASIVFQGLLGVAQNIYDTACQPPVPVPPTP